MNLGAQINAVSRIGGALRSVCLNSVTMMQLPLLFSVNGVSGYLISTLESTIFGGKITYFDGLIREAQNIGRFSINLGGSGQGVDLEISGSGNIHAERGVY